MDNIVVVQKYNNGWIKAASLQEHMYRMLVFLWRHTCQGKAYWHEMTDPESLCLHSNSLAFIIRRWNGRYELAAMNVVGDVFATIDGLSGRRKKAALFLLKDLFSLSKAGMVPKGQFGEWYKLHGGNGRFVERWDKNEFVRVAYKELKIPTSIDVEALTRTIEKGKACMDIEENGYILQLTRFEIRILSLRLDVNDYADIAEQYTRLYGQKIEANAVCDVLNHLGKKLKSEVSPSPTTLPPGMVQVYAQSLPVGEKFLHKGGVYEKVDDEHVSDYSGATKVMEPHYGCIITQRRADELGLGAEDYRSL